jgi:dienelactone hydrolase
MQTESLDYSDGETKMRGWLAHPVGEGRRPAVLVAPTFAGCDDFARGKAEALAQLGYVGFALDPYGEGKTGATREESRALMQSIATDRPRLRKRMAAAIDTVRGLEAVDPTRVAAIGFCFGGLCALDMARMGADLRGVATFHGILNPADGLPNETIRAKVLVLHGWDDPMVPPERVVSFAKEMTDAGVDFQIHAYGHTVHSFSNPQANDRASGTAYEPNADRRAWIAMRSFLEEVFETSS